MRLTLKIALSLLICWQSLTALGQVDELSAAGDSLAIRPEIRLTLDAIRLKREEAEKSYLKAIEADSTYSPAYYMLAKSYDAHGEPNAKFYAAKAYTLDSLNHWYRELYAKISLKENDLNLAEQLYKEIVKESPRESEAYRLLSLIYQAQNRNEEAIALLDSAELRLGLMLNLETLRQQILFNSAQGKRALEEAIKRVEASPLDANTHLALANVYNLLGDKQMTISAFKKALEIDPMSPMILLALAEHHMENQNYDGYLDNLAKLFDINAISLEGKISLLKQISDDESLYREHFFKINPLVSSMILQHPKAPEVVEFYASHLIKSGLLDQALELYKEHIYDQPLQKDYIHAVIDIESYMQRTDSVDLYIDRAIELFPDEYSFRLSKASALARDNLLRASIESYKGALLHISDSLVVSDVWGMIGDLHHMANQSNGSRSARSHRESFKAYDKALEVNPSNYMVLNNYAYHLSELDVRLEEAERMSKRSLELLPGNATFLDTYGWILFKMGDYDRAREYLRQAVSLDTSESAEIQLHYGDLLAKMGEKFMAEVYWRKAEKLGYEKEKIESRIEELKNESTR